MEGRRDGLGDLTSRFLRGEGSWGLGSHETSILSPSERKLRLLGV